MSNNDLGLSWADEADDDEQETPVSAPQSESPALQSTGNSSSPPRQSSSFGDDNKLTLFVNNIPYESSNETVRRFFEDAGCKVVRSWVSGKGSGNVAFEDIESLQTALSLQDKDFGGRNINIKPARPSQKRDDFRRGGDQRRNNNGRPENRGDGFKRPYDRRNDDQNRRNNNERRHDNREERGYDNRTGGPGGPRRDQNSRSPTNEVPAESPVDAKERPKLQLLPRTVPEIPGQPLSTGPNKSNPFGAARPREVVLEERKKLGVSSSTESPQDAQPGSLTSSTEQAAPSDSTPTSSTSESTSVESQPSETTPSPEQGQEQAEGEFQEQAKQKAKPKPKPKGKPAPQQTQQQQQQQKGKQNNRAGATPNSNPKAKPKPTQAPAKAGDKKKGTQNIYAFLGESSS